MPLLDEVSGQFYAPVDVLRKQTLMDELHSKSGRGGREKNLTPSGNRTPVVHI